jgi:hypothetical protein
MVEALEAETTGLTHGDDETADEWDGLGRFRHFVFAGRASRREKDDPTDLEAQGPIDEHPVETFEPTRDPIDDGNRAVGPPPPVAGRLVDAEVVDPALRLGYRGDARGVRDAAFSDATQRPPRLSAR